MLLAECHPFTDAAEGDEEETVYLVSDDVTTAEVEVRSSTYPFGAAALGKRVGEAVEYEANGRKVQAEIIDVRPHAAWSPRSRRAHEHGPPGRADHALPSGIAGALRCAAPSCRRPNA
ncbi:GreA/GreB family elongation factor [Streptomyces jumonjinensis]|uniref:GreA/GreB family elongation factor n=1 Tax=Streptomyces jumonjinensis TaxID=1945 RepID=A0A646KFH4_STRJU|nr:GreA/GreB family elongation factor [Streptomyces jumonjinensis]